MAVSSIAADDNDFTLLPQSIVSYGLTTVEQ